MRNGIAIQYGDVAPEAKENFIPTASESEFDTLAQLQQYNLNFPNFANPCELYSVVLDGTSTAFPSVPENANMGLWSAQISNNDGTFTEPIVLTLESVGQYSSQGFTLTFDTYNDTYANNVNIQWYQVVEGTETLLDDVDFTPNSAVYFCKHQVSNFNKVVITFYSINMPKNRLKLRVIDYGYGTIFYGDELRNVKLIQEIDPISTQISINTADFTLDSKFSDIEYSFQKKQPLSIYFNGELKATTFVKTSTRKAKRLWNIQSEDYIGLLDGILYKGGMYDNANAVDLLEDIFNTAKVPYDIDDTFENATVTGYIPYTTCREALMQVAFAIQAVIDTSNSDVIKVFALDDEVKQTIPLTRIMQGQNFVSDDTVTAVDVSAHTYKPITETVEAYNSAESGIGQGIKVIFSEPLHDLSIVNGTIVDEYTNYAVINANANCILSGQQYEHTAQIKRRTNPNVLSGEIEKILAIDNATLVSRYNVDNVLEKCYNWLIRTNQTNLKIVEGKHVQYGEPIKWGEAKWGTFKWGDNHPNVVTYDMPVNVGENISAETEYLGVISGRLIKQSFNLNGNIIVKEAEIK